MSYRINSIKDVLLHLAIIIVLGIIAFLVFFNWYLPNATKHGETITVPNLQGISYHELDQHLTSRNLRFEVDDSTFSSEYPPLTVMKQYPRPGQQVKENRKIFIALNATNPPDVKMPRLVDSSVRNAQLVLKSFGLELGEITYKPDPIANTVLEQRYKGREISEGQALPKGSKVDLIVGDGRGEQSLEIPNLLGMDLGDAEFVAKGSGLQIGEITYEKSAEKTPNTVLRQIPPAGAQVRVGEVVDLWVVEFDENNIPQRSGVTTEHESNSID